MKIRRNLILFSAFAMLFGVGAGLTARKHSLGVSAAGGTKEGHTVYCAIKTETLASYTLKINSHCQNGSTDYWEQEDMIDLNDTTTYPGYKVFSGTYYETWGGLNNLQFQLYNGSTWVKQREPISSWTSGSWDGKLYKYDDDSWESSYTPTVPTHSVKQYAVVDGTAEAEPFNTINGLLEGSTYYVPGNPVRTGYHFVNWYEDAACNTVLTDKTIGTSDLPIYAKFTTIVVDSYFYWTDKDSGDLASGRVYFFGEYQNSWDEGPLLSTYEISGGALTLKDGEHVYKIPAPSTGNYQVIIHNGDVQTVNMTITLHSVYYTWFYYEYDGKYYYDYSAADAAMTEAVDFLVEAEELRNSSTYKGLSYSVCGVDKDDAASLVDFFDKELSEEAQGFVNAAKAYTYNPEKAAADQPSEAPFDEVNVSYADIIAKLREIAAGTEPGMNQGALSLGGAFANSNTAIIVIISISLISVTSIGVLLIIKRRRRLN